MTTTARTLPAHGTYARANGSPGYRPPCTCQPCLVTRRRHKKRLEVNRKLGRPNVVDAAPARRHLNQLHKTMAWTHLSQILGCNADNLTWIADGRRTRILRSTSDRILAIQPGRTSAVTTIDATGTRRRIQALQTLGYTHRHLATEIDCSQQWLRLITGGGHLHVRKSTADKVAAVYRRLATTPGPSEIARRRALALGWASPMAWDDIDDPKARPIRGTSRGGVGVDLVAAMRALEGERIDLSPFERTAAIEMGVRRGMSCDDIAHELRMDPEAVRRSWERIKQRNRGVNPQQQQQEEQGPEVAA